MRFEKISYSQFLKDCKENDRECNYEDIILPKRATTYSAGYDFFSLIDFELNPCEQIKIPTGIRVILESDKFLAIVPRSSLGFKYRLQLDNTIGIIDADYAYADNEGHIWLKMTNDTRNGKILKVNKGDAIAQGVICRYFMTDDDCSNETRHGGIGSTSVK